MTLQCALKPNALVKRITAREFVRALEKTWSIPESSQVGPTKKFGLAISGGVDSMALAALCSRVQSTTLPHSIEGQTPGHAYPPDSSQTTSKLSFRAFVVDHGVRVGSNVEANSVAKVLEARGIPAQILKVDWGKNSTPAELPNFETLAREHRFQLLGKACRDSQIKSLLLAHHEDDQVETVLIRMLGGHRGPGLAGIRSNAGIPECYGIHGVSESGGFDAARHSTSMSSSRPTGHKDMNYAPLYPESEGVRIYRPMLGFSKDRLIETCKAEGMQWFEDNTNQDPTLTTRNAVRHVLRNHNLPAAFSKSTILGLAERCQEVTNNDLKVVDSYLARCQVSAFETRSGSLKIAFPLLDSKTEGFEKHGVAIAARIVRHIIMLITPEEHVPISSLHTIVRRVFPGLFPGEPAPPLTISTIRNVIFEPSPAGIDQNRSITWTLRRQPYNNTSLRPWTTIPPSADKSWSEWTLWDGRFWIRVLRQPQTPIIIRPFDKEDPVSFRKSLAGNGHARFKDSLAKFARGDIRFTLPSLAIWDHKDGSEKVVALPSLGLASKENTVQWEIRYKKVYWEGLPPKFNPYNKSTKAGSAWEKSPRLVKVKPGGRKFSTRRKCKSNIKIAK